MDPVCPNNLSKNGADPLPKERSDIPSRNHLGAGPLYRRLTSPTVGLVVLLLILTGYRLTLIDSGHFFWSDERCFLPAVQLVDDLAAGDFSAATQRLFEGVGRPGFIVVSIVPALGQRLANWYWGIAPQSLQAYDVVSAFNVLIALAVTAGVYVLTRRWTGSAWYGVLAAAVYSLLASSNVWIRHAVPYNESLLLFMLALIVLSPARNAAGPSGLAMIGAGLLTAFAYTCYPGHYSFVLINGVVALVVAGRRLRLSFGFAVSALAVLAGFEALSQSVGLSYLHNLRELSGTVTMGYTGEGYVFPWRYLRDVEGPAGIVLLLLFLLAIGSILLRRQPGLPLAAKAALPAAVAACLLHGALGVHFGKMVFYGRLLLQFIPLLVAGAVIGLLTVQNARVRRAGLVVLGSAAIASFTTFAWDYSRIAYPADVLQNAMRASGRHVEYPANMLWGFVDGNADDTIQQVDPECVMVVDTLPEGVDRYVMVSSHDEARTGHKPYIGVNFSWLFNVRERDHRFTVPDDYQLVATGVHPAAFPAISYEAYPPWCRRRLVERHYRMRLYRHVGAAYTAASDQSVVSVSDAAPRH